MHVLDGWQTKEVGGLQFSAPLEPSPAESKRLSADRDGLEHSSYGVRITKGIVVAIHSFAHPPSCKQLQLILQTLEATEGAIENCSLDRSGLRDNRKLCTHTKGGGGVYRKTLHPHLSLVVVVQVEKIQP